MWDAIKILAWFAGFLLAIILVNWFKHIKVEPDPWAGEVDEQEIEEDGKAICLNCSRPIDNPSQHYCPNCGNITGEYTRYIPFVNIRFNCSIFGNIWHSLKDPETSFAKKFFSFILIFLLAPVMLLVFGVMNLCGLFRKNNQERSKDDSFDSRHY